MQGKPITARGREIDAEVFAPKGNGPASGILVLHEVFGLLDFYFEDARDLANRGYLVYRP